MKRTGFKRKPNRNQIPAASRAAVRERSQGICEIWTLHGSVVSREVCGVPGPHEAHEMHHKKPRRFKDHSPENLLHACSIGHGWITVHPQRAVELGLSIRGNGS